MNEHCNRFFACSAFAINENSCFIPWRNAVNTVVQIHHHITFANQLPVTIAAVMLYHLPFATAPARFRLVMSDVIDRHTVSAFILKVAVKIHCGFQKFVYRAQVFRDILRCQRSNIIITLIKTLADCLGDAVIISNE